MSNILFVNSQLYRYRDKYRADNIDLVKCTTLMVFKINLDSLDPNLVNSVAIAALDSVVEESGTDSPKLLNDFAVIATILRRKKIKAVFGPPIIWPKFSVDVASDFRA
ncbi:MAG: hypothetical protein FJ333_09190, partial [Sphingomonadales bacterium]|nr:hypothetical protein [Sphingomonadales bacterium]